jgi:ribose transport system substrate-binding protein
MRSPGFSLRIGLMVVLCNVGIVSAAIPKVGFVLKDRSAFWAAVEKTLRDEGPKQGADVVVSAPMAVGAAGLQIKLFNALTDQHCDVIAISPMGIDEYLAPIAAARAKGIKVMVFDSPFPDGAADAQVGLDQDAIATAGAEYFVKLVHDGDEVSVLRSNGADPFSAREKKLRQLLRLACPNSVVHADVYIGIEPGDEVRQAALLLTKHPETKAIFTPYTATTLGMMRALAQQGLAGKIRHVGFGISMPDEVRAAIEHGALQAWVVQQPDRLAQKGIEVALALATGKSVPPITKIPGVVVTRENLHDPAIQALTVN